jgi:hypothetical protein
MERAIHAATAAKRMTDDDAIELSHFANAGLIRYLEESRFGAQPPLSCSPDSVKDPYYTLGTHPDLVERLWDQLGSVLPEDCRWVLHGTPVLIHPHSRVAFAFATGTLSYALRLAQPEFLEALEAGAQRIHTYPNGSVLDLANIGDGWVFGRWLPDEPRWCLAAYEDAAASNRNSG